MLHSRASCAKWERRGTKIPESVQRVPEKVPELFGRVVHALLRAIFSVGCYLASRGTPRSRRGGRRFKSCHSDHASPTKSNFSETGGRSSIATGTVIGTEMLHEDWARATGLANGSAGLFASQALREGSHRCLARRGVAVRWHAVLVVREGERPHPPASPPGRKIPAANPLCKLAESLLERYPPCPQ